MASFGDYIHGLITQLRSNLEDVFLQNDYVHVDNNFLLCWWLLQNDLQLDRTERFIRQALKVEVEEPGLIQRSLCNIDVSYSNHTTLSSCRKNVKNLRSVRQTAITLYGLDFEEKGRNGTPIQRNQPKSKSWTWFGGFISDIKNRYPMYPSDIKDGFNFQCLAAILFISFAQISGSIAFGGLMGSKTEDHIGICETLLASALGGIIFSLFSGQPLLIVGTTGPLLLFDESLFNICKTNGIDFLSLRTWIGFWLALIATLFVGFEGSKLVRFFTRFTQEVFSALISLLFIAESIINLKAIYNSHPLKRSYDLKVYNLNGTEYHQQYSYGHSENENTDLIEKHTSIPLPNTALLSTMLMLGTFGIAWFFRAVPRGLYFTKNIRKILGNFAVPIAIVSMVLLDHFIAETETEKLILPGGFSPTTPRDWLVNPGVLLQSSWVLAILSVFPAFLLFILLFMEISISELIVSKKDNKLRKGTGFHLDVLLTCVINTLCSILGLAWVSLALVRCVAHVSALTTWSMPKTIPAKNEANVQTPAGEKSVITGVKEQRVTAFVVSLLTSLSILCAPLLVIIPMAVLYGVFLFMGVASMSGIQLFDRITLFFKQVQNYPQVPYAQKVGTFKMHLFTVIQIAWLILLWGVKYTQAAMSFPFILLILVPLRFYVLPLLFSREELRSLDHSDGNEVKANPDTSLHNGRRRVNS